MPFEVYRIGSRYSKDGTENPVFDIFREHEIVFANVDDENGIAQRIRGHFTEGQVVLFAIADSKTVKAIGKMVAGPASVADLSDELRMSEYRDEVGFRVQFFDLNKTEFFDFFQPRRLAHIDDQETSNQVIGLFKKYSGELEIQMIKELLEKNKQLILTGAPGTGKTFLAKKLAAALLECEVEKLTKDNPQFGFVQFHPAYDYTDFVEGLKPVKNSDGKIAFELRDGIFRAFCRKVKSKDKKFVFVIDEINRADLSRVFGELFFAIEPDYRGEKGEIRTQYASLREVGDEFFSVPENVFIIGTMNDIDRSVESLDFALRRRFVWHEVEADGPRFDAIIADVLVDNPEVKAEAKRRYNNLNQKISESDGLGRSFQIGPAYFRKLTNYVKEKDIWAAFWKHHIEPLLREYVRGMPDEEKRLAEFEIAYNKPQVP